MAATRGSGGSAAQRRAIASLLRIAKADLADAHLLAANGQPRNAAALGCRSLTGLVLAVAASEHGWPAEDATVRDIPRANPVQPDLVAVEALLEDAADLRVQPDGRPELPADATRVAELLDRLEEVLQTVADAFGADLDGAGPSATAAPIRPPKKPPPPQPQADEAEDKGEMQATDTEPARPASVVSARAPRRRRGGLRAAAQDPDAPGEAPPPPKAVIVGAGSGAAAPSARPDRPRPSTADGSGGSAAVQSGPLLASDGAPRDFASTVFWALMDRWKLSDTEALNLIGHPGGLTKKGTRPRFRVAGKEAELFGHLREIDAALSPLVKDPGRWLRRPIKEAPFGGATPLDYITRVGVEGSRAVERAVLMAALRKRAV